MAKRALDVDRLASSFADAVGQKLAGMPIQLDGEIVGRIATERVSRNIAKKNRVTKRYAI